MLCDAAGLYTDTGLGRIETSELSKDDDLKAFWKNVIAAAKSMIAYPTMTLLNSHC